MVSNDLNDEQIINLLLETGYDENEIKTALKTIKNRTVEGVYEWIENKRLEEDRKKEEENKEVLEKAKRHKEQLKIEAEYKEKQLKRINEKIKLTQEENRRKEEKAVDDFEIKLTTFYKFRVALDENKTILIGLNEGSTIEDLYKKVELKGTKKNFVLRSYGDKTIIERSNEDILKKLKIKHKMLLVLNK